MADRSRHGWQDSPIDLGEVRIALDGFKAETEGIRELGSISEHILALEDILRTAKRSKVTFSTVRLEDFERAGVVKRRLILKCKKVTELSESLSANASATILDLHSRIKKIYSYVNMDSPLGLRMVLDEMLLGVAEIVSGEQRDVAIFLGMKIPEDVVCITHPSSGYELGLSGNVDCAVTQYEKIWDNKARLLAPGGFQNVLDIPKSWLFIVQVKYESPRHNFCDYIPNALGQAIAMLQQAKLQEVHFCLSDGQNWLFFILTLTDGIYNYYESTVWCMSRAQVQSSDRQLREIVQLLCEWLQPAATDLYILE